MSVAQLPSVESPSQSLARLQEHFSADSVYLLSAPYHIADLSLDNSSNNLVIVQLPETGATSTAYRQSLIAIGEFCPPLVMLTMSVIVTLSHTHGHVHCVNLG